MILVTGGAGYIGSILTRKLLDRGEDVRILDKFDYGLDSIKDIINNDNLEIVIGDVRDSTDIEEAMDDVDAVVHLAAIVGDPACAAQADVAVETNYLSTLNLARAARDRGVERFVFASTCSVYGAKGDDLLTEDADLNPVSLYAETKIDSENGLLNLDEGFNPTILRFGTVFGLSPRMRFDLVINYLTKKIILEGEGMIFGGDQYRPFVHVEDIAESIVKAMDAPQEAVGGEIINIGANEQNYPMREVGEAFEKVFSPGHVRYVEEMEDKRSYRVDFSKARELLEFTTTKDVDAGIREIREVVETGGIEDPNDRKYYNYNSPDDN